MENVDRLVWKRRVLEVLRTFKKGFEFTSDDLRTAALRKGVKEPADPNHWGQVVQSSKRLLIARKTGSYRPTARRSGHRRVVAVWVRV